MSNGKSRAKGKRGELDVVKKLGGSAKRTGHSFVDSPVDVDSGFDLKTDAELEDILLDLCGRPELSDREVELLRAVEEERERRRND